MQFRVFFLRSRYRIGIFFGVAKISNIFLGCLKFLIFLGVNGRCWVRAYICEKIRVPPPPGLLQSTTWCPRIADFTIQVMKPTKIKNIVSVTS